MVKLNFPTFDIMLKNRENTPYIFDVIRKKWVKCTPEEWVRVHCIHFLIHEKNYPASWIQVERELSLFGTKKRFDILVHTSDQQHLLLVECKAPTVALNQKSFDQILRYQLQLKCPYLMLTNGLNHYFCEMKTSEDFRFIESLPSYTPSL